MKISLLDRSFQTLNRLDGRDGYSDFYKKDLTLNVLGPVGDVVSEWVLKGCIITAATFGEFNYDNTENPLEISLTLALDYAVLNY